MSGDAALVATLDGSGLSLRAPDGLPVAVESAGVEVVLDRGDERLRWRPERFVAAPETLTAEWPEFGLCVEAAIAVVDAALVVRIAIENRSETPVRLVEVAVLHVIAPRRVHVGAGSADSWSVYRNGYQSWSGTRAYGAESADADPWWSFLRDSQTDAAHPASGRRGEFRSDLVTAIVDRSSCAALALGFLDTDHFMTAIEVDVSGGRFRRLAAVVDADARPLAAGERLQLPALWIAAGATGWPLLERWATACGAAMQARVPDRTPIGWCSWYYYFTGVTEADVLDNLESLQALRPRVACDYVQVDDGYQRAIGDWLETRDTFPHGMRWLAQRIQAAGFDAGIWIAPFLARPESRLFRERPDWLVRTRAGRPRPGCWNPAWSLGRPAYVLDTTNIEVLDWLRELARTVVRQWGYRVLKLDFLYAAALPGVRADGAATRAEALRRGLEAIRDGAGPDAFLLGCGCPLGPAIGIVDGMRIGADVAPFWDNLVSRGPNRGRHGVATAHALRNIVTRAFMHRRLWLNDPDCLMVRAAETRLTPNEVRSLATAIALTDGMFVLSDRLDGLPSERLEWIERMLPLLGGTTTVDDMFERDLPETLRSSHADGEAVGVFNFGDRPAERSLTVTPGQGDVRELWSGVSLPVRGGVVSLGTVPPHGCRLLWLPRAGAVDGAPDPA